ncbi:MAG: Mur ligase domain-containing protein [Bacteroidota bacterium]|nr:Mur ligase domain-containing protein [Bacteroidota bacterium]
MKKLKDILKDVKILEQKGQPGREIGQICFDSRKADAQSVFVALKGTRVNGHDFIPTVLEKGVKAIVCEEAPDEIPADISCITVPDAQ